MSQITTGIDGIKRCHWASTAAEFPEYHDNEWGFPVADDRWLFEKLCLESFQSGLSWRTILVKRNEFRKAFDNFEFERMAGYGKREVQALLQNAGIIRHRGKIEAVINNAQRACEMLETEGSLAAFIWGFEPDAAILPEPQSATTSTESIALAKALKQRGWKFVGPTTAYAFMQSMGLFNDHAEGCAIRDKVEQARRRFKRPGR